MSVDPHAPTPAGPDPDERTEDQPAAVDPVSPAVTDPGFVPPGADFPVSGADPPAPADTESGTLDTARGDVDAPVHDAEPLGGSLAAGAPEPPLDPPDFPDEVAREPSIASDAPEPTPLAPAISFAPEAAEPPAPADDWLSDDANTAAAPGPDPLVSSPAFGATGAQQDAKPDLKTQPRAKVGEAKVQLEQAKALTDRPEVMVGLAFAGGVLVSFVLKRFGR